MPATAISGALDRYFQVSLFLLVAAGFATLATTGRLDAMSLLFVFGALALRGFLLLRRRELLIPERWTTTITLVYVLVYAADYFLLSRDFIAATVHLVLFAMVVKIFSVHRDRDYLYLAVLAFLEVLAASVLTVDTLFLGAFALFLLLAVNTFVSFEMRRSATSAQNCARDTQDVSRQVPRSLVATGFGLVVMILLLGGAMFFFLPRVTAGYLSSYAPQNDIVSGFHNEVNLGRIGEIKQLSTVVMHVQVFGDQRGVENLKWRGVSLGLFDGRRWANPFEDPQVVIPSYGQFNVNRPSEGENDSIPRYGQFDLYRLYEGWNDSIPRARHAVRYRVLMEPIGTNVFFLAPKPDVLFGAYREISADSAGALYNSDRDHLINTYEAISVVDDPPADELRASGTAYPPGIQLRYLQLPKRVDPRVHAMAEQITARAATPYDKSRALETYLKTHYGYTLHLPATPQHDPIANFLFDRKEGHCEFFASSMAVMLRTLGIPARVVNGFRGGELNRLTGSYIVRARDAHTWVEAYFPGNGWVSFDPTPPDPHPADTTMSRFLLYLDAGREFWREWVINYDFAHQRNATFNVVAQGRNAVDRTRFWLSRQYESLLESTRRLNAHVQRSPRTSGSAVIAGALICLLLVNARRLWMLFTRLRLARHPERAPHSAASIWYERLLRSLARRGWRKLPSQTPQEFLLTIGDPRLRRSVSDFTEAYERARFADSAADAQRLPALFDEIASK